MPTPAKEITKRQGCRPPPRRQKQALFQGYKEGMSKERRENNIGSGVGNCSAFTTRPPRRAEAKFRGAKANAYYKKKAQRKLEGKKKKVQSSGGERSLISKKAKIAIRQEGIGMGQFLKKAFRKHGSDDQKKRL